MEISGSSSIGSMMNLGRVGEARSYPASNVAYGSSDKKWEQQINAGNIVNERLIENNLRPKKAASEIEAIGKLNATMDSFVSASKNTISRLDDRLPPQKLEKMGFGKNRDWAEPLNNTADGLLEQMKMISEALWQDGRYQDETIRERLKDQVTDSNLSTSEKEHLKRVADGFHHIRNMSLNYSAAAGDIAVWVATESKGGKASDTEADRISFQHLSDQIEIYPELAILIEELDDAVVKNISNKDFDMNTFFGDVNIQKKLNLDGYPIWKREYLCDLALNWYRIIGFPDIRKYGNRTKQYKQLMPSGITSGYTKPEDPRYLEAVKAPNFNFGLSPYFFLMDPLSLQSEVLKQSKEAITKARVGISKSKKTDHSVISLGWRPAAWDFIDHVLSVDIVGPDQINDRSLKDLGFSNLTQTQWENFLHDSDAPGTDLLQKQNIKFAEKAMNTRGLLMACMDPLGLSLDNIGKLFGAVADLIRTEKNDTLFNRTTVAPLLFQAITYTGLEANLNGVRLNIKADDADKFLRLLRLKYKPVELFTDKQIRDFKSYCS